MRTAMRPTKATAVGDDEARRAEAARCNYQLELDRQERRRGGAASREAMPAKTEPEIPPEPTPTNTPGEPADLGAHLGALQLLLDAFDDNPDDPRI